MGHDSECELLPVPGYPAPRDTCHCATRAYVRDPFRPDGGPVVPHPNPPRTSDPAVAERLLLIARAMTGEL